MNSDSAKKRGRNGNRLLEKGGEIESVGLVSERKQYLIVSLSESESTSETN